MGVNANISAEDRRAAASVTVSGSGHKFEIQLGHLCNNRCVFCSSGQLTAMKIARPIPIEPIIDALVEARAAGATHLTFLGGEPTIHKHFLKALEKAVELGFGHIVIFTNGVMFPHPGFIDSVTALGSFEWRISIQGATEDAHVATTGRADSFQRIVHGLGELKRRGQLVTTNMCVNERSYRSLPHYPELLERYGVRQLHVDIVRPESTGERNEAYLRDIMPRYADMAPYYDAMLAGFERSNPDFDINVGNLPYCVLPKWGSRIHHGGQQTVTKSSDGTGLEEAMNKYDWHESLRTHLPGCADCVFRSRCTGIFRVYLEMHGGEEFKPLSRAELLAIDPERRNFVILVEPLLAPLHTALNGGRLPAGWRLQQEISEDRLRRVEMLFAHDSGAPARLRIVAPGHGKAPVISSAEYDIDVEAGLAVPSEALGVLLSWVREQLATIESVPAPRLAADAIERSMHQAVLQRGRQRVAVLSARLQSSFALPGWQLDPLRWSDDITAEISALGPAGARIDVSFKLGSRDNRSQVGVDFRTSEVGNATAIKTAVDTLVQVLRASSPARTATEAAAPAL